MSVTGVICIVLVFFIGCYREVDGQCDGNTTKLKADGLFRTFSTPNYPNKYPRNATCEWLIEAPSDNYIIRMDTLKLDLESDAECSYDSVAIYNGNTKTAEQRRFCRGLFTVYTTGRYLLVQFTSDNNVEYSGFLFRYFALLRVPSSFTPSTIRTTPIVTEKPREEKRGGLNKGLLIGGVVGGICFVVIMGIICGRCLGSGGPRQPPVHRPAAFYHSHAPPTPMHMATDNPTISTAVHMVQNNNAVFMVSQAVGGSVPHSSFTSHLGTGLTNAAFDGSGETSASVSAGFGFLGPPIGIPPPSYDETMLVTHPPTVPPTPRHAPNTALAPVPEDVGLTPPPLYAPRDPAATSSVHLQPGIGSEQQAAIASQPSPSGSAVSSACPPQQLAHTTALRMSTSTAASAPPIDIARLPDAGFQRQEDRDYSFEYSSSIDSLSTPTESTILTSPSLTISDLGSPTRDLSTEDEVVQSLDQAVAPAPQIATSSEWPDGTTQASSSVTEEFVAVFPDNTDQLLIDLSPAEEGATSAMGKTQSVHNMEGKPEPDATSVVVLPPEDSAVGSKTTNEQSTETSQHDNRQKGCRPEDNARATAHCSNLDRCVPESATLTLPNGSQTSHVPAACDGPTEPAEQDAALPEVSPFAGQSSSHASQPQTGAIDVDPDPSVDSSRISEMASPAQPQASRQSSEDPSVEGVDHGSHFSPPSSESMATNSENFTFPSLPFAADQDDKNDPFSSKHCHALTGQETLATPHIPGFASPNTTEAPILNVNDFSEPEKTCSSNSLQDSSLAPPIQGSLLPPIALPPIASPQQLEYDQDSEREHADDYCCGAQRQGPTPLSAQSTPTLTERQLRNSSSFQDIAGPAETVRKEALHRADSQ